MTDTRIEQIRERWGLTNGYPWEVSKVDPHDVMSRVSGNFIACGSTLQTTRLIASAPEDIEALLSIIDEQKARIEELERPNVRAVDGVRVDETRTGAWNLPKRKGF